MTSNSESFGAGSSRFDSIRARYVELTGRVPESIEKRLEIGVRTGRVQAILAIEAMREELIMQNPLGHKIGQLVHFAQLVALGEASPARLHAGAALKAGASLTDLMGVAELSLITSGIPAYSLAIEIVAELSEVEDDDLDKFG
ncbi:MAG: carboxymuconolactone decarboxylase family protein [Acidimicrobiaceae bacterium]|nr:carboxymuconolactone decarboxylase family protein [Acidimicrobiaceae bacterium]